jgi:hypothetical protein
MMGLRGSGQLLTPNDSASKILNKTNYLQKPILNKTPDFIKPPVISIISTISTTVLPS